MTSSITSAESAITGIANLNPMSAAIAKLYSSGNSLNEFMNQHILVLQQSENSTIATTGQILESAKFGFGLGYISSVAIIAVGQLILGNNLLQTGLSTTVGNSLLILNPIAMTCGAIGAIVYGWTALSSKEQDAIVQQIQQGLEIGVELIKSIIQFVIVKVKNFLDTKYLEELKDIIASQAHNFGKTLSDVTRATSDKISETVNKTIEAGKDVAQAVVKVKTSVVDIANEGSDAVVNTISSSLHKVAETANVAKNSISDIIKSNK
jgi:hypothetical protein